MIATRDIERAQGTVRLGEDEVAALVNAVVPFVRIRTQFNPAGFEIRPGDLLVRKADGSGAQASAWDDAVLGVVKPELEVGLATGQTVKLTTKHGPPTRDLRPWLGAGVAVGAVGLAALAWWLL